MLLNLPEEILIMIAIHLDVHTILRLRRVRQSAIDPYRRLILN